MCRALCSADHSPSEVQEKRETMRPNAVRSMPQPARRPWKNSFRLNFSAAAKTFSPASGPR